MPKREQVVGRCLCVLESAWARGVLWIAIVLAAVLVPVSVKAQDPVAPDCERVLPPDLRKICDRGELRVVRYGGERQPFFFREPAPKTSQEAVPESGGWIGFDIDLGRDMAERLGVRYREVTAAGSFDAVVDRVADGSADIGLSKLSATLARAQRVRFSRPYLTVYQALLVNRLSEPAGGDPFQALNASGFTVGALGGTAYVGYVRASLEAAEVRPYNDFDRMMGDVVAGTIDAALMDSARSDAWRRAHQEQLIHVRTTIDRSRSDPLAIAVAWENTHLLAWVNLYLERIRSDATAGRLYKKWFDAQ